MSWMRSTSSAPGTLVALGMETRRNSSSGRLSSTTISALPRIIACNSSALMLGVPQIVAAAVAPKQGLALTFDELVDFCKQRLASFKKPEKIFFLPELPRNPLGKVLKKDLKQRFAE